MENVKNVVAQLAEKSAEAGNAASNNMAPDNAWAPDSHNNNNDTNVKVVGDVAGDNKAPDNTSSHNNNNNTYQVPAGAAALPDQDVVMVEVGLALANSLARAMEDGPSDARAWTEVQFPDGVLGMVAFHPDTTVGTINERLANTFGARCWFLGFQMVAGYTIAAPPRYTMRDLGELRTDLAIGSFMEDYYEE